MSLRDVAAERIVRYRKAIVHLRLLSLIACAPVRRAALPVPGGTGGSVGVLGILDGTRVPWRSSGRCGSLARAPLLCRHEVTPQDCRFALIGHFGQTAPPGILRSSGPIGRSGTPGRRDA